MTWEPTDDEIAADLAARRHAAGEPWRGGSREKHIATAGLRAAYALLEQRVNAGELLAPTAELIGGGPYEYREAWHIGDVNRLAADGWRLHTVQFVDVGVGDRGCSYVLERRRPDPS
jgi:hypothetical protein